eukprot:scaffold132805_cov54-Phaeocystis_antarctica.AAC.2
MPVLSRMSSIAGPAAEAKGGSVAHGQQGADARSAGAPHVADGQEARRSLGPSSGLALVRPGAVAPHSGRTLAGRALLLTEGRTVRLVSAEELVEEARGQPRLQHQPAAEARPRHPPVVGCGARVVAARVVGLRVVRAELPRRAGGVLGLQLVQVRHLLHRRGHVARRCEVEEGQHRGVIVGGWPQSCQHNASCCRRSFSKSGHIQWSGTATRDQQSRSQVTAVVFAAA